MTYQIDFEQRIVTNQGKIVFTATREVGDDATVNVYIDLVDPSGDFVNTKNFGTPDLAVTTPGTLTWDIPVDSNGDKLRGEYTVSIYVEQTATAPGVRPLDASSEHYFTSLENITSVEWDAVCIPDKLALLTVKDTGDYDGLTILSRELRLVHPPITNLADTVIAGSSIDVSPGWSNVTYLATAKATVSSQEVDGDVTWNEFYDFSDSSSHLFLCSDCDISECVEEFVQNSPNSPNVQTLLLFEMAYRNAVKCGRNTDAAKWAEKIKSITKCDCGCSQGTGPIKLTQSVTVVTGGSGTTDGADVVLDDAGGYFIDDDLESVLQQLASENFAGPWTLLTNSDSFGTWDFVTNPSPQLQWRKIGNKWIEMMGTLGNTGLTANTASTFMFGYFEALGISLKAFYGHPVSVTTINGSTEMKDGGVLTVQYAGTSDNFAIHVSKDVTPVGVTQFYFKVLIPIA